jgi:glucuronoarabinoxylan endo-1,4-beta-xylanase
MKFINFNLAAFTIISQILFSGGLNVRAAAITWSPPANITGDNDVSTLGTQLYAETWGAGTTVNGVTFANDGSKTGDAKVAIAFPAANSGVSAIAVGGGTSAPYSQLSSSYKNLVQGLVYGGTGAAGATTTGTIMLQGLTVGNFYQVQIWINDSRSGASGGTNSYPTRTAYLSSAGGNSVGLAHCVGSTSSSPAGGLGQYVIGTFTADATTQAISLIDSNSVSTGTGGTQLNSIRVANIVTAGQCTVDWNTVHQRIDGFGASSAWDSSTWSTAEADLFFSTNNGCGLSLLRSRIAPDGTTVESSIMQMAQARGATVWSTPWSPPAIYKSPNSINGGAFVSSPSNYQGYAAQLASYVVSMKNTYGLNIYAISVQNEPDVSQTYESSLWTAQQIHDFIPYLSAALLSSNVASTKIMLPEDEFWQWNLATNTMNDSTTSNLVGVLAAHDYSGTVGPVTQFGNPCPKPVWETEHYFGTDDSITNGVALAEEIHTFMTVANANAYHYWWLEGSGNGSLVGNSWTTPAKRIFVIGNFSRFVRPNYYRIGLTTNTTGVFVSAYKDSASPGLVIVAINPNPVAVSQTFQLTNGFVTGTLTPWITSGSLSLSNQPAIAATNSIFNYALPAMSVATFVGKAYAMPTNIFISNASYSNQTFILTWNATAGAIYSVQKTNNLASSAGNWPSIVTGYPFGGAAAAMISYTDVTAVVTQNFYRVTSP